MLRSLRLVLKVETTGSPQIPLQAYVHPKAIPAQRDVDVALPPFLLSLSANEVVFNFFTGIHSECLSAFGQNASSVHTSLFSLSLPLSRVVSV